MGSAFSSPEGGTVDDTSAALSTVDDPEEETGAKAETDGAAMAASKMEAEIFIFRLEFVSFLFCSLKKFGNVNCAEIVMGKRKYIARIISLIHLSCQFRGCCLQQ